MPSVNARQARAAGAIVSLAIHIGLALAILSAPARHPPTPVSAGVAEEAEGEARRLTGDDGTDPNGLACAGDYYDGIGILTNGAGLVSLIGAGTPAERGGLRPGDLMINHLDLGPDRYRPGTAIVLRVRRGSQFLDITVTVRRICRE